MTFQIGSHISEQTNTILEASSSPMTVKNPRKDSMVLSRPTKQARDVEIDLINQRQVLVAFGVLDFIDADGIDLLPHPVLQPKVTNVFHRVETFP